MSAAGKKSAPRVEPDCLSDAELVRLASRRGPAVRRVAGGAWTLDHRAILRRVLRECRGCSRHHAHAIVHAHGCDGCADALTSAMVILAVGIPDLAPEAVALWAATGCLR